VHVRIVLCKVAMGWHEVVPVVQVRCAEVARTLADLEASEECIASALLHSVLDSSMLTEEKLRMSMCAEVADTVCNVHKLSGICQVIWKLPPLLSS
jgi:(p)ppGpp synthase/HD superfamily hydrolase